MKRLMGDQDNIGENLRSYIQAFTPAVRDIFESFEFHLQVDKLDKAGLLYMVCERFAQIDLHPETVSNAEMGLVFEELIRKFAELSNETAGEHFTPRDVSLALCAGEGIGGVIHGVSQFLTGNDRTSTEKPPLWKRGGDQGPGIRGCQGIPFSPAPRRLWRR
jgi:hypothetical protein